MMFCKEFRRADILARAVKELRRVRFGVNIDPDPQEVEPE